METANRHHHTSVKGVVVYDQRVLLVEYFDEQIGTHYNFPGGRQHADESIPAALERKLLVETGARVAPGPLLFVYEYIGKNHALFHGNKHSVSLVFECALLPGEVPTMERVTSPEKHGTIDPATGRRVVQTGLRWVTLAELPLLPLFPGVGDRLVNALREDTGRRGTYWGDIV